MTRPIFLDSQATTPLDPAVADAMRPFNGERYGNPHSLDNEYGRDVAGAIEGSRASLACAINAQTHEMFYTSGATESNNWLVHNIAAWSRQRKIHIIISEIEHASLIEPIKRLEGEQLEVTWLPPNSEGLISVDECKGYIQDNTVLISVMAVNNEIGVIQPLHDIGALCKHHGLLFHSDAAQAIGKIPFDVQDLNLDFVSLSSHKAYGPMGVGALYISSDNISKFQPLIVGGGQQRGLRSGTLPVSLCVGFGTAYELAEQRQRQDEIHLRHCRDRLLGSLQPYEALFKINGSREKRVAGNLNIRLRDHHAEHFLVQSPELAFSRSSACTTSSDKGSHVLASLGLNEEQIEHSFRLSLARTITMKEIERISDTMIAYLSQPRT